MHIHELQRFIHIHIHTLTCTESGKELSRTTSCSAPIFMIEKMTEIMTSIHLNMKNFTFEFLGSGPVPGHIMKHPPRTRHMLQIVILSRSNGTNRKLQICH